MSTKAPPLTKYRYRRRLPHLQKANAAAFVTFCTGGRLVLPGEARDLVLEHCLREHGVGTVVRAPARHSKPKEKADHVSMIGLYLCGRRPDPALSVVEGLPHTFASSTIGPAGLNLLATSDIDFRRLRTMSFPKEARRFAIIRC